MAEFYYSRSSQITAVMLVLGLPYVVWLADTMAGKAAEPGNAHGEAYGGRIQIHRWVIGGGFRDCYSL